MSEADVLPRRRLRWPLRLAQALLALVLLLVFVLAGLDTDIGHRFIAEQIAAIRGKDGMRYRIGRIDGSIYSTARLTDVRVLDPEGLVLQVPQARLDWRPLVWAQNRLEIRSLTIPRATWLKLPKPNRTGQRRPILPGFDIVIGRLEVQRLTVGPALAGGRARTGRLSGAADIRDGRAMVRLAATVPGTDQLRVVLDAEPDGDRFDVEVRGAGAANGVLAGLTGLRRPVALAITGDGRWKRWRGSAQADAGGARIADLRLSNEAGHYTLAGELALTTLTKGKVQRLSAPRILVEGGATLADRQLSGALAVRSAALAAQAEGRIDLAESRFRDLRVAARLIRPPALFANMTGRAVALRAILDGPFATAAFDYRLTADWFAFDRTRFERASAAGRGRLSRAPVLVPVRFAAARVTGIDAVASGILRNLTASGVLRVTPQFVTGTDIRVASDQLNSRATLFLDLRTGRYEVGLSGRLNRALIPGLGVVDVDSRLTVVPGPTGKGTRVVGTGEARVVRLDNAFFRSLAGGLPRVTAALERAPDGTLHFRRFRLVSPELTLMGDGYRRRDGTFHFEGSGRQARYGPVTIRLDGPIGRPVLDLVFASPNETLGLQRVVAHLDPTPQGFTWSARGASRLGPFEGAGAILLPRGGEGTIRFDRLDVTGTRATGALQIVTGGFEGLLDVRGGGLTGDISFRPDDGVQVIDIGLLASNARISGVGVRRGRLDATVRLEPDGAVLNASATAAGLERGALRLARLQGTAKLRGETGRLTAAIAGTRGRAFAIQGTADVSSEGYRISAQGTVDRRPIRLETPALLRRDGDGWRLDPVRVRFAGGEADIRAGFGGSATMVEASLKALPLSVLDIGYPGLGLGGAATGTVRFYQGEDAPTARIDMTVRGLTRSGLVLTSEPIDLGVAAVLDAGKLAARAVAASGGRTVGRAQLRAAPLGEGPLFERIAAAPLFGQLRYDGPAATLWRLTGIELFDLSGPVAIAADVGGTLSDPSIRGLVRTTAAQIESPVTGLLLTDLAATGRFGGSRLVVDRFTAKAREGSVSGSGTFDLAAARGFGIDISAQAERAVLIRRDDIGATVTGPLTIRSDGNGGVIAGDVRLDASRYRLGQAEQVAGVPRIRVTEINRPEGDDEADAVASPWRLDVRARAPDGLAVTGLGLDSEWSADVHIRGEPTNPIIEGRADLIRGDVEFASREFDLERGLLRFDGSTPANPSLDIAANADATGLRATIRVTGTAEKPEIGFTSIPALPEDELLSRLLFGTSITNLSAPEALQLAAAVAALQGGGQGLNPINALRRAAGLDRLRIVSADPQTGQGTSIAAGKFLTRRTYVEIVTDGQGYSATRVEFQVTRWLSILSSISTLGRQSANIRVSRDY